MIVPLLHYLEKLINFFRISNTGRPCIWYQVPNAGPKCLKTFFVPKNGALYPKTKLNFPTILGSHLVFPKKSKNHN